MCRLVASLVPRPHPPKGETVSLFGGCGLGTRLAGSMHYKVSLGGDFQTVAYFQARNKFCSQAAVFANSSSVRGGT